jgi:hypothetical protein
MVDTDPSVIPAFIGLLFANRGRTMAGIDCWGAPYLMFPAVTRGRITVPAYDTISCFDVEGTGAAIAAGAREWVPVAAGEERLLDLVVLRVDGSPTHVGVVVEPGLFLHIQAHHRSRVERLDDWRLRVVGFYRHRELA